MYIVGKTLPEQDYEDLVIEEKYLVIYSSGEVLSNVGIFEAENKYEAIGQARDKFNTSSYDMTIYKLDNLYDGWTHFV